MRLRPIRIAVTGLVAVALVVLSGCAGATGASRPGRSSAASGTLTVALSTNFTTLDPEPLGSADDWFILALYDPLVLLNSKEQVIPMLATSWKTAPDDHSVTFQLRKGVTFSDGTPLTATAVAWNINWVKQPSTGAQSVADWAYVTPQVINKYEIRLNLSQPLPQLFGMLANTAIVQPNGQNKGIGTGPFKVSSFVPGTSLTVVRNPHYWMSGEPKIQRIVFKDYPDLVTAGLALESHSANLLEGAEFSQVKTLEAAGFKSVLTPSAGGDDILVNVSKPPLNNAKVREALSLAFNRKEFVQVATEGYDQPLYSIFPPSSPAYTASGNTGSYSLAKAKSLLDSSGVSLPLNLTIEVATTLPQATFMPIYKQDLAEIGINLTIDSVDTNTYSTAVSSATFPELIAHQYGFANDDPALLFVAYPFRPTSNAEHYLSSQYQSLVAQAASTTVWSTRLSDYEAINRYVQQQAFAIPLATNNGIDLFSPQVSGLNVEYGSWTDYSDVQVTG